MQKRVTPEDVKFLADNCSKMSAEELSAQADLSIGQVTTTLGEIRKTLRDSATTPEELAAVKKTIRERFIYQGSRNTPKKGAIKSLVSSVLSEL